MSGRFVQVGASVSLQFIGGIIYDPISLTHPFSQKAAKPDLIGGRGEPLFNNGTLTLLFMPRPACKSSA